MKILVHLNHKVNKSYLLTVRLRTLEDVKRILEQNEQEAVKELMLRSAKRVEITPSERSKALIAADYVVSQRGYIAERLA